MADEYDQNTGSFVGEYVQLRPTSAWQYTIPSDLNYYETKAVINSQVPYAFSPKGYIELNGIPRIPTRAYYRRKVKEEFHTKKIDKDFVDASGNLVLANVDNPVMLPGLLVMYVAVCVTVSKSTAVKILEPAI